MKSRAARSVRLGVEQLETRELPSAAWAIESFENAPIRSLPTGWLQWNAAPSTFQVTDGSGFGSDKGLVNTANSDQAARTWMNATFEKDVQIQADVLLDSLAPVQLFARGQNLETATPTFYAVSVTRGMTVELQRVVNGQTTTLAKVDSATWFSNQWSRINFTVQGNRLQVQVFRTDTAQFLTSNGQWQTAPTVAIDRTDTMISSAGRVGLARPAKIAGTVAVDNFGVNKVIEASSSTNLLQQDFSANLYKGLPVGWSSYTNTTGQTFTVAATNKSLTGSSAVGVTGSSGLVARAWADNTFPENAQVSAALYLDSLVPAQIFARGQDLNTDSPDYYAVGLTRGAKVQLLRVIDGRTTVLGSVTTDDWLGQQWVQATLSVSGTTLRVQVYRADTGRYLTADGQWQVLPTWALEKTDTAIRGPGRAGIGRGSGVAGPVSFDNFLVTTSAAATTPPPTNNPPPATTTGTRNFDFDSSATGSLPSGWSSWTNGKGGAFAVTAASTLSAPNGLVSNGTSAVNSRAWFNGQSYNDVQIAGSVYVDSLIPSQLFVRGQNLGTDRASYYAVSITRGLEVQLIEVNAASRTVLGTLSTKKYDGNMWVAVGVRVVANTLEVVVVRQDTNQYLRSDGTWQTAPVVAMRVTDGTLTTGFAGVARPASYNGRVLFDDLSVVDLGQNSVPTPPDDSSNTDVPPPPTAPPTGNVSGIQHYSHIRVATLAYYGTPIGDLELNLLKNSVDLVVVNPAYLDQMEAAAPNTTKVIYTNVSNIYLDLLTDWLAYADRNNADRESAFYHVSKATAFSGDSSSSRPVTNFWSVQRSSATGWADITSLARKNAENFAFAGVGHSVVIGYPEKYRELNVTLQRAPSAGWAGVLEYASAVDANGNPTAWKTLQTISDATSGFKTSGRIAFDPPPDWKAASINGSEHLFFIRVRTTQTGTPPTVATLLGRDYVYANGTTRGVIPAFDSAADKDGDGYLNDLEYAKRRAGFDARFNYESRLFYPAYGQMRFATNPSGSAFRLWAADFNARFLAGYPKADGLFVDNSFGRLQVDAASLKESLTSYAKDYGTLLAAVNVKIGPRWVLANTAGAGKSAEPLVANGVAYLEEFALRPLASNTTQFEDAAALVASRMALSGGKGIAILDTYPQGGAPTDSRTQIAALAEYYLLADPKQTMVMFNGGFEPATTWTRHWTEAVKFNVGLPSGKWSMFASGLDPANRTLTYKIYQREYQNALVLYKPLSYAQGVGTGTLADATATTHVLNGNYRVLNANGTLGSVINRITLRNGEGAILVKA